MSHYDADVTDPRSMQSPSGTHDHGPLGRTDLDPDPIAQFRSWLAAADAAGVPLANAIALATADASGSPSVRHVLLRGITDEGFLFFTNHGSRKGRDLAQNPHGSFTVLWRELDRQVCVRGGVSQVSSGASDDYFATRPRDAQLGAWASRQSEPLADRAELERRVAEASERFGDDEVPRPRFWGGYLLTPDEVEFWQGRPFRLHDRFRYTRSGEGWRIERLSP
jgi:pyridoxamine 5'-phosphate oxidase